MNFIHSSPSLNDSGFQYRHWSLILSQLVEMIDSQTLDLHPKFRYRSTGWSLASKSKYIESLLLGMPSTNIIFEENIFGHLSVLDGTQRLRTLYEFIKGEFPLKHLKLLPQLNKMAFEDLPYMYSSNILDRNVFNMIVVSYDTHPVLKFEFYKRINSGNPRFLLQSARNYAFQYTFDVLKEIRRNIKVIFHENDMGSYDGFQFDATIDQFILYLITTSMLIENVIDVVDSNETISELLDRSAQLINEKKDSWSNISSYISSKINLIIQKSGHDKIKIINPSLDVRDDDFYIKEVNINDFINAFIINYNDYNDNEINFNKISRVNFYELRKSSRFLTKFIKGYNNDNIVRFD